MNQVFHCKKILFKEGWKSNVTIQLIKGKITSIETSKKEDVIYSGIYIPGFQNAHSHSFQYAMSGLAEVHQSHNSDDFWSWREAMYHLALQITPDQFEAIATKLYAEMLKHGWTNVTEFHYLHHDNNGSRYNNLSEMGERLISAAKTVGINITLIPIFYQKGGFGKPYNERQRRFISNDLDQYLKLLDASKRSTTLYKGASIGIGVHSLRGVDPKTVTELTNEMDPTLPFHIHISEQLKEVEDAIEYLGSRPVEWLLDNCNVNDNYHLVHATHLTENEVKGIAKSNAHVVICPSTEGNLGDGLFPLIDYQNQGGKWSLGTDSHVGLNPLEELRILDYGQRLISHKRNIFTSENNTNAGHFAIEKATLSGMKAMGNNSNDYFTIGSDFNACMLNENEPLISSASDEHILSTLIYSGNTNFIQQTITRGMVRTDNQQISNEGEINTNFIQTCKEIGLR